MTPRGTRKLSPLEVLRRAMPARRVRPHRDCPPPERLTELAIGQHKPTDRDRLMNHVVGCGACSELLQILMELDSRASGEMTAEERLAAVGHAGATMPPHGAVLAMPPDVFRWPSVPGATSYTLVIYDAEANLLWDSEAVRDASVRLPERVVSALVAGERYYWRVFAVVGEEQHGSPPHEFTIEPAAEA